MVKVGDLVSLGNGTAWAGDYKVLAVIKVFDNGKVAVKVNFRGKVKVFHI